MWLSRWLRWLIAAALATITACLLINVVLIGWAADRIFDDPAQLPANEVALVLGTSRWSATGTPSPHFRGRMEAAAGLVEAGSVVHLLASGANPDRTYNEPQAMYRALREAGVPDDRITLDFAGRRTLDSVVRARQIFQVQKMVIVSQRYHLPRALFLAQQHGIDAIGFAAKGPPLRARWRVEVREVLARVLAVIDAYVLRTDPQILGEPEPLVP